MVDFSRFQNQTNPSENFLKGLNYGMQNRQLDLQNKQIQQNMQAKRGQVAQSGMRALEFQAKQEEIQRQRAAGAQFQGALQEFAASEPTPEDYTQFLAKFPDLKEQIDGVWAGLSKPQKDARTKVIRETYAALKLGDVEMAQNVLSTRAEAYREAGLDDKAVPLEAYTKLLANPKNAPYLQRVLGLALSAEDPDFAKSESTMDDTLRANESQPGDLVQTKAQTDLIGAQADKARAETENKNANTTKLLSLLNGSGAVIDDPASEARFTNELRKTYIKETENYRARELVLNNVDEMMRAENLKGADAFTQTALVYMFMKSLDPTSAVLPSEFAGMADRQGFLSMVGITPAKLTSGKFLTQDTVTKMRDVIAVIKYESEKEMRGIQKRTLPIMKQYGLQSASVFGEEFMSDAEAGRITEAAHKAAMNRLRPALNRARKTGGMKYSDEMKMLEEQRSKQGRGPGTTAPPSPVDNALYNDAVNGMLDGD